jgi:hypothetical protein
MAMTRGITALPTRSWRERGKGRNAMSTTAKNAATIAVLAPFLVVWSVVTPAYLWTIRGVLHITGLDK